MSTLMDDANVALRRLVRSVLSLGEDDVRPAPWNGDAGHQGGPYATVKIIDVKMLGNPARSIIDDGDGGLLEAIESLVRITASVQFFKATQQAGFLRGAPASQTLADYTGVTNGGFDVRIDGTNRQVTGLNFSGAADLNAVAALVRAALAGLAAGTYCVWTGKRFIVTSPTTGQTSAVGYAMAPTGGGAPASVSTLLGLTQAAGAVAKDNASGIADFSSEAIDRARRLVMLLCTSTNGTLMQEMGLGFLKASQVRNLAGTTDASWEGRASVDLDFNFIARETVPVPAVVVSVESPLTVGLQVLEPRGTIIVSTVSIT